MLNSYLADIKNVVKSAPILDLASGSGRNGLYLVNNDLSVIFSDIRHEALEETKENIASNKKHLAHFWQVDFEQDTNELKDKHFSGVLVFRYLHRPLFENIKNAVLPGGFIIYETFTLGNEKYGRPKNPDFLLAKGELIEQFKGWQILHQFEGIIEVNGNKQAIAQIVAIKPEI
ncbi:class I SAM-dependent methyltransferase [Pseudoalteromonas sp. C2R02]|nr:class I SAM-dependent methyltransferase [Pseudoalteromonas sp. C2R02]